MFLLSWLMLNWHKHRVHTHKAINQGGKEALNTQPVHEVTYSRLKVSNPADKLKQCMAVSAGFPTQKAQTTGMQADAKV